MTSVAEHLDPSVVGEAASPQRHPIEWWYANVQIEAPGAPIHGMTLISIFSKFDGVIEEHRRVIISPEGGIFADFGSGPLTRDSIRASATSMDVTLGRNRMRGAYPSYTLDVDGEASSGARIEAHLLYTADVTEAREGYIGNQLKHWVIYRADAKGTIRVGDETYDVTGLGYMEHLYGTLGWLEPYLGEVKPPTFVEGWNWYWSPAAGPSGVVVQAGGFIRDGEAVPFASICADGREHHLFVTGTIDVLERRTYDGVSYTHKFRLTDSNPAGSVDITITRLPAAQRAIKTAPGGSKVAFITGYVSLAGTVTIDGVEHDVTSPAFGSVFTVSLAGPMLAARELPAAIRVPLGRVLRVAQQLRK
ncbi:hypothetical protein [Nocardia sp. NPDC050718]|uniref:hypothetical protein n=1 Tax=Nocardia sp. NPDC050718 TaxID=3155788 RepID=UPI0033D261FD